VIPAGLIAAIEAALQGGGSVAAEAARLHRRYREGGDSRYHDQRDALAYAAGRMPATAAAVAMALDAADLPACRSLLDLEAGTGSAAWAAHERFELHHSTLIERDDAARAVGERLAAGVFRAAWKAGDLRDGDWPVHDLVTAGYSLGELPQPRLPAVVDAAWAATAVALVVVEPGTPDGAAVIESVRERLIASGAWIAAPCPHHAPCPLLAEGSWCHRRLRLLRARFQRHAKGGSRGFEDEAVSYLLATRHPLPRPTARIVSQPRVHKAAVDLTLCTPDGLEQRTIPRRDAGYKAAKKLGWGDSLG